MHQRPLFVIISWPLFGFSCSANLFHLCYLRELRMGIDPHPLRGRCTRSLAILPL